MLGYADTKEDPFMVAPTRTWVGDGQVETTPYEGEPDTVVDPFRVAEEEEREPGTTCRWTGPSAVGRTRLRHCQPAREEVSDLEDTLPPWVPVYLF